MVDLKASRRLGHALIITGLLGWFLPARAQIDNPLAPPTGTPAAEGDREAAPPTNPSQTNQPSIPGEPLPLEQLKALVLIEGDYSDGSGFVAKMHGQYFIVTNQHVLAGNTKYTITGMDGTKYPTTGPLYGSMDYDVAILKIPDALAKYYLEIQGDAQAGTKPGDSVTVPGNSEGNGVPVQINGKLIGVGPELVEVDAKFVHGNSGSPIIHRPSGKVIGIATMVRKIQADTLSKAANMQELHWLGYRLDNIKSNRWTLLDWTRFSEEGVKVRQLDDLIEVMIALLEGQKLPDVNNKQVDDAIVDYVSARAAAIGHNSEPDYVEALQNLFGRLQSLVDNNVQALATSSLYPYYTRKVKEDQETSAQLDKAFLALGKVGGHIMGTL